MNSAAVTTEQWDAFIKIVDLDYPEENWTPEQRLFVEKFVIFGEEWSFSSDSKRWLTIFRDHVTVAAAIKNTAELNAYKNQTVAERLEHLKAWVGNAVLNMKAVNEEAAVQTENDGDESYRILQNVKQELSERLLPQSFLLDMFRCLCFRKMPSANSWEFAGESCMLRMYTEDLFLDINPGGERAFPEIEADQHDDDMDEPLQNDEQHFDPDDPLHQEPYVPAFLPDGSLVPRKVWKSGTKWSSVFKLIFFNVCKQQFETTGDSWNPRVMTSSYVVLAIDAYNSTEFGKKDPLDKSSVEFMNGASKTITETWFKGLVSNAREGKDKAPSETFNIDAFHNNKKVCTEWNQYFMYYLNTIKSKPSRSDPKAGSQGGKSKSSNNRKLKKARLEKDPPTEGADTEEGGDLNAEEVEVRAVKSLLLPSSYYHHHLFYK